MRVPLSDGTLPLTYDECRARFRRAAGVAGAGLAARSIGARGPNGQVLTIDVAAMGSPDPRRVLVVMSGVHGVEGFIGSAVQCDLLGRLDPASLPVDVAVVLVHAVNPWGMAWWRRQNESNVDLNRNWARDRITPPHNEGYDELHPLLCPDTPEMPDPGPLVATAMAMVEQRGIDWVRDAITVGQYTHPDGLHFGGDHSEASTLIVEELMAGHLAGARTALTVDLHTGHGPYGTYTLLSDQPLGSEPDGWLRAHFDPDAVMATEGNPGATTGTKVGQIANGLGDLMGGAEYHSTTLEFGTAADEEQIVGTWLESWVHRHGDRDDPAHAAVVWEYRRCFTPDDPAWVLGAREQGRLVLDAALGAVAG